jgi:Kinesin motor domain
VTSTVQVVVRCRPLNTKEKQDGRKTIVSMEVRDGQVLVQNPKSSYDEPAKSFTYDQVYGGDSQQLELFSITAKPIVASVMAGYNGTIFAYGQTGTGMLAALAGLGS